MGTWWQIGILVGIGVALGILAAGIRPRVLVAAPVAALLAAAAGYGITHWEEAVGGGVGGIAGAFGAAPIVSGALRRGGTRLGTALLVAGAAVITAGLAFAPVVGYLEALVVPALALRLRSKEPERYAGLRTLARD